MTEIKNKYNNFCKRYADLENAFTTYEMHRDRKDLSAVFYFAIIRYFELAYESGWRFVRQYLIISTEIEYNTPQEAFIAFKKFGYASDTILESLLALAQERNRTNHIYDQAYAQEVFENITKHYQALGKLFVILPSLKNPEATD